MLSARISAARRVPAFARLARFYSEGDVARSKEFSCVFFSSAVFLFVNETLTATSYVTLRYGWCITAKRKRLMKVCLLLWYTKSLGFVF